MKYQITVSVDNSPDVDSAALISVLSYILTSSIKQVPGVVGSSIEVIETIPEKDDEVPIAPEEPPVEELPVEEESPVEEPSAEEPPTDSSTEEPPVEEPPVESPPTE